MRALVLCLVIAALLTALIGHAHGWMLRPPGTTNAVLSAVVDGKVEIVRWWPHRSRDVNVHPLSPVFWDGCLPGQGAIMTLLTAPVELPPVWAMANPGYYDPNRMMERVMPEVMRRVYGTVQRITDEQIRRRVQQSLLPGEVAYEALKAAVATEVRSMATYEKYGYAVFMFLTGGWWGPFPICRLVVESVPEGYGIPYVR
jgi:hypothetical protein